MTVTTHAFTGRSRCSNCLTWGEHLPISNIMMKPQGGEHVRRFCSKKCRLAWCFRYKIVPMEMLPPELVNSMRLDLLKVGTQ